MKILVTTTQLKPAQIGKVITAKVNIFSGYESTSPITAPTANKLNPTALNYIFFKSENGMFLTKSTALHTPYNPATTDNKL